MGYLEKVDEFLFGYAANCGDKIGKVTGRFWLDYLIHKIRILVACISSSGLIVSFFALAFNLVSIFLYLCGVDIPEDLIPWMMLTCIPAGIICVLKGIEEVKKTKEKYNKD
tara:strand:- start:4772 stop:5104 length:333 start_codon:yes stop_codon:yes gene_type:complete